MNSGPAVIESEYAWLVATGVVWSARNAASGWLVIKLATRDSSSSSRDISIINNGSISS